MLYTDYLQLNEEEKDFDEDSEEELEMHMKEDLNHILANVYSKGDNYTEINNLTTKLNQFSIANSVPEEKK